VIPLLEINPEVGVVDPAPGQASQETMIAFEPNTLRGNFKHRMNSLVGFQSLRQFSSISD
jgi:hypothetical protein